MGALDGVKVLDLSRVIAGPYCGQMLADNGAEVIKVESPEGDLNRAFPMVLGDGTSTNNLCANRGKRGISLNLKEPRAREILYGLVEQVDVVIQSFLPKTAQNLGVDYESLRARNPRLIYASISGYGAKGPLKDKPGYDLMVAAYAGIMSLTGEADGPPVKPGVIVVDLGTAMLTYSAILSALFARAEGRCEGQRIDTSLLETGVSLLAFRGLNYLNRGVVDKREGAGYSSLAPYGAFACADGDILIGAATQRAWESLCAVLELPELLHDPRFEDGAARCENAMALRGLLEVRLGEGEMSRWLEALEGAGVPSSAINTVDRVLEDPQVAANDMIVEKQGTDGEPVRMLGLPFNLSGTPGEPGRAPPGIGEHNEEVLGEYLGLSMGEVDALRREGVL